MQEVQDTQTVLFGRKSEGNNDEGDEEDEDARPNLEYVPNPAIDGKKGHAEERSPIFQPSFKELFKCTDTRSR